MALASVTHVFTLTDVLPIQLGRPVTEIEDLGRASSQLKTEKPEIYSLNVSRPSMNEVTIPEKGIRLALENSSISIRTASFNTALIVIKHKMLDNVSEIARLLDIMCSDRERFLVNGEEFIEWLRGLDPALKRANLGNDVFQIVDMDQSAVPILRNLDLSPSVNSQALILREKVTAENTQYHSIKIPKELNRRANQFVAHGRGVMVVAGLQDPPVEVILFVATQLLLAIGQIREMRNDLQKTFANIRKNENPGQAPRTIEEIRSWTEKIRLYRAHLVLDIIPAVSGLDSTIEETDNFRESFGESLRIKELLDSGTSMLNTLSEIAEIDLKETQLAVATKTEARERNWRFVVGLASGLVVPIALVLAYFSVGTSDVFPHSSMFDWNRYWLPWMATILSVVLLLSSSTLQFLRSKATDLNS
jgi:hypothetical protein